MGFIRTVLILVVAFYIIGFIGRLLVPFLIRRQVRKYGQQQNKYKEKKEGEITIDKNPKKNNILNNNDGEYVDYEEIE